MTVQKTAAIMQWVCVLLAGWFAIAFMVVALGSLHYPFDLEWMEGQSIDAIQRVLSGLPLYAKPSVDYVPFIYTPLYYYVCGMVSWFTGVGFFAGRLVSLLSALGCGAIIYTWICHEGGGWKSGIIGAGLFFATYPLSGRWFDLARVDSMFLCLTLAGLYVFYTRRGWKPALVSALLLLAAFFTKQSVLVILAPVMMAGLYFACYDALVLLGAFALMLAFGIFAWDGATDGWFSFYVFTVPSGHEVMPDAVWGFWMTLFKTCGVLCVMSLLLLRRKGIFYGGLLAGLVLSSYVSTLHSGGWINVMMPAHAGLALFSGLFFVNRIYVLAALLLQMGALLYNPLPLIPNDQQLASGQSFINTLAAIDGDVLMSEMQYVGTMAGKKSYAMGMAAIDLRRAQLGDKSYVADDFNKALSQAIVRGKFVAIIPGWVVDMPEFNRYYSKQETLPGPREYVTGAIKILPVEIYTRIPDRNP